MVGRVAFLVVIFLKSSKTGTAIVSGSSASLLVTIVLASSGSK
jgi:hypothetical protein